MKLVTVLTVCLFSFALSALFAFPITALMKRIKAKQPILQYVELHKKKAGTPTMGGLIFILPTLITTCIFGGKGLSMGIATTLITVAYALIGALDDFLKIKLKKNEGLKAWQKLFAQLVIAILASIYCYKNPYVGGELIIPFTSIKVNLKFFAPFLYLFVYLATTNAVNLTDGLDGLATSTGLYSFLTFAIIMIVYISNAEFLGENALAKEYNSLLVFISALIGGLLVFLFVNTNPADIFMGDTGSLALGGALASVSIFSKNLLLLLLVGIMYVVSCITVIMQVVYFKLSGGKRIFLMAPLHHHLQMKGFSEGKIVSLYSAITFVMGIICIISVVVGVYGVKG